MKVYIWGTGQLAQRCMKDILPDIEIMGVVESYPNITEFMGKKVISGKELAEKDYDYIIMANSHEEEIMNTFHLDEVKVVYYQLSMGMDEQGKVLFDRRNADNIKEYLLASQKKLAITEQARSVMPCVSLQVDGIKFLFDCNDNLISNDMLGYGETYAKNEMIFFYSIAPKKEKGFFLEIGANVGTTSIYFKKKLADSLNYICFEPIKENYKYLKMNCILNDCEDIKVENIGMSNQNEQKNMYIFDGAYGSSMVSDNDDANTICTFMTLDKYIEDNVIDPKDIAYIWADVQCHELEVVEGAIKTLKASPASLYIEFSIAEYRKTEGKVAKFLNKLSEIYNSFIVYEQYTAGKKDVRDIKELVNLPNEIDIEFCNILLMK